MKKEIAGVKNEKGLGTGNWSKDDADDMYQHLMGFCHGENIILYAGKPSSSSSSSS